MHIWLRDEARETERRAPLTPAGAASLIADGAQVTVERSDKRIFPNRAYADAGCALVSSNTWLDAPQEALILGVKELPSAPPLLRGHFAHFAHLFKQQQGWRSELARFDRGGARLSDLEYLTDAYGTRVAAFGYWAGWLGAALALWGWLAKRKGIDGPFAGVSPASDREAFLTPILKIADNPLPRAVIVGALGRSGQGAYDLFAAVGMAPTLWDKAETAELDRNGLLAHDILVSCVLMTGPGLMLIRPENLPGARLSMIADVACDPFSDFNPLPIYDVPTPWGAPYTEVAPGKWVTAIDNLPSLLPKEASEDFAGQLLPTLKTFPDGVAWQRAQASFEDAVEAAKRAR